MADIELVIKIDEEMYNRYMNYTENYVDFMFFGTEERLLRAVRKGTPLPKGHGRLIDADYITKDLNTLQDSFTINMDKFNPGAFSIGCNALTIIEADTESEE